MPKALKKYVVSFNGIYDDEYGDTDMNSADYTGDNVESLAREVNTSDASFPLAFVRNTGDNAADIIGWFVDANRTEDKVAVMLSKVEYFSE